MTTKLVPPTPGPDYRSHFEKFEAKVGVIRLREFYKLSPLQLKYGKGEATLIRSSESEGRLTRLALQLRARTAERERTVFLDEDEIGLVSTIVAQMEEARAEILEGIRTYTELSYTSRGGFVAGYYFNEDKSAEGYMVLEGETFFMTSLGELGKVVDEALFQIEMLRSR